MGTPYIQQVHAGCGGAIVLMARSPLDWCLCCRKCRDHWRWNDAMQIRLADDITSAAMGDRDYAREAALERGETVTIQEEQTRWR